MPRVAGHPNREPFRGVLTLVDAASDKPPAGSAWAPRSAHSRGGGRPELPFFAGDGAGITLRPLTAMTRGEKSALSTRAEIVGRNSRLWWLSIRQDFPR